MADDGKDEFHTLLNMPTEQHGDHRTVLHNSLTAQYLLVERGITGCNLTWHDLVEDFLENWFSFLETSNVTNLQTCASILRFAANEPDLAWCAKKSSPEGES